MVVPAAHGMVRMWQKSFGYQLLGKEEEASLSDRLVQIEGSDAVMMKKPLFAATSHQDAADKHRAGHSAGRGQNGLKTRDFEGDLLPVPLGSSDRPVNGERRNPLQIQSRDRGEDQDKDQIRHQDMTGTVDLLFALSQHASEFMCR